MLLNHYILYVKILMLSLLVMMINIRNLLKIYLKTIIFFLIINRENDQVKNYIKAINTIPKILINEINNLLILRNDLCFKQDLDYSRISKDKILTQWNLFHRKSVKEMADQIQFIGASLVNKFVNKINTNRIDTQWTGSLHNFYNYCVEHLERNN